MLVVLIATLTSGQLDVGELRALSLEARGIHDSLIRLRNAGRSLDFHHRLRLCDLQRFHYGQARSLLHLLLGILLVIVLFFILIADRVLSFRRVLNVAIQV